MRRDDRRGGSLGSRILAGAFGGLIGSWAMTQFHVALYGRGVTDTREPQSHRPVDVEHDATTKAADTIARVTTGHPLGKTGRQIGGPVMHYAFGITIGALYGALADRESSVAAGNGLLFGAAVWLFADELLMPALSLSHGPRAYPLSVHAEMLAAHLVYGVATHGAMDAIVERAATARLLGDGAEPQRM